ncbi:MAG: hypothetical protein J2P24_09055 [Streptosporangiales bacterium]|nr:hypothetical protein [Streptosporangiales bacterium]MBO0889744.1 hypothetical protein [Acidothermales bacterium]
MARRGKSGNREPRRWTFVLAAMVAGLVVVGAVFVELSSPSGSSTSTQPTDTPTPSDSPTPTVTPSDNSTTGLGCGVTDTSQKLPTTTPRGITWVVWRKAALPRSSAAGPLEVDDSTGVTGCYADTPVGAVLAAVNISYRATLSAPDTTIIDEQVADGPYKQKLRVLAAQYQAPDSFPQLAGFRFISYSKQYATVSIAIGNENGYATSQTQVMWQGGTWKMVATADDLDTSSSWQDVDDIDGYVPLKGVG